MIVVAIIGLLAAIGIPQYQKFQAKARQSEVKTSLGALYSAARSFKYEWDSYTNNLMSIGFGVEGRNLRYISGFQSATVCARLPSLGFNGPSESASPPITTTPANISWTTGGGGNNSNGATWALAFVNHDTAVGSICTPDTFSAVGAGDPRSSFSTSVDLSVSTASDRWTIDQNKQLQNINVGIN